MIKKEWYIFQGAQHRGPFDIDDLKKFFAEGTLKKESLVWREEAPSWEPLHKFPELESVYNDSMDSRFFNSEKEIDDQLNDLPPPLPALPVIDEGPTKQRARKKVLASAPEVFKDPTRLDLPPVPELMEILKDKERKKFDLFRFRWHLALVFVIALGIVTYLFLNQSSKVPSALYIRGLNPSNLELLENTIHRPLKDSHGTMSAQFEFALTVDGKNLWLTSNISETVLMQVTLTSKPNRILGSEETIIESRAKLQNHQAKFSKVRVLKGSSFSPGEYRYKLKGKKIHFLNSMIPALQAFSFFRDLNTDLMMSGETIIYSGSRADFENRLVGYKSELANEALKPFEEKKEKIQTLKEVLNKSVESLQALFLTKNPPKEMMEFEQLFIKEVSPILQSIVNDSVSKNEDEIVEAAKNFGESITDLMTFVQKKKSWTKNDASDAQKALKRLKAQVQFFDLQIQKIDEEMKLKKSEMQSPQNDQLQN